MEFTISSQDYIGQKTIGYMVNAPIGKLASKEIGEIQKNFKDHFGDSVWLTPEESLHITLLDWIAPLVDYGKEKDELFDQLYPKYNIAMDDALDPLRRQELTFNRFVVSPSAIAIVADAAMGVFNTVRQQFLSTTELLPGTKLPPTIVHATILRFVGEIAVKDIETFAQKTEISVSDRIDHFRLVRESTLPMLDYSVIKTYPLKN